MRKSGFMGMRRPKEEGEEKKKEKESEKKKEKEKKLAKRPKVIEGIRGIVRIAEVDIAGDKKIRNALLEVKGIGQSLARGIAFASGLNPEAMIGSLTDEQIKRLEEVIKNPVQYGIPFHMLNRQKDPSTGENKHVVSSELKLTVRSDIDFLKKIRAYRGIRHELGLPVRGQRTRSSFRTGARVGVAKGAMRKALAAQRIAEQAPAKGEVAKPAEAPKSEKAKPVEPLKAEKAKPVETKKVEKTKE